MRLPHETQIVYHACDGNDYTVTVEHDYREGYPSPSFYTPGEGDRVEDWRLKSIESITVFPMGIKSMTLVFEDDGAEAALLKELAEDMKASDPEVCEAILAAFDRSELVQVGR